MSEQESSSEIVDISNLERGEYMHHLRSPMLKECVFLLPENGSQSPHRDNPHDSIVTQRRKNRQSSYIKL
jgi:hypothetical protein